jgi:hypothetical protein
LGLTRFLGHLRVLDDVLDVLLLVAALFSIAPPRRSLVIASKTQMGARLAAGFAFFTLLASQSTCEAT